MRSLSKPGLFLYNQNVMAKTKLKNSTRKAHPASHARVPAGRNKARAKTRNRKTICPARSLRLTIISHLRVFVDVTAQVKSLTRGDISIVFDVAIKASAGNPKLRTNLLNGSGLIGIHAPSLGYLCSSLQFF